MRTDYIKYRAFQFTCDNCGKTEEVVVVDGPDRDEKWANLPLLNDWRPVPVHSFVRDTLDACSQKCAEALALAAVRQAA